MSAYLPTVKTLVKLKKLPSPELSENKIKINKNKKWNSEMKNNTSKHPHPNQAQVMQTQIMKEKKDGKEDVKRSLNVNHV